MTSWSSSSSGHSPGIGTTRPTISSWCSKARLRIELRDRVVELGPGELFVVPKGVEHRPVADEEVHLLLIEPTGTPNTGDPKTAAPRTVI